MKEALQFIIGIPLFLIYIIVIYSIYVYLSEIYFNYEVSIIKVILIILIIAPILTLLCLLPKNNRFALNVIKIHIKNSWSSVKEHEEFIYIYLFFCFVSPIIILPFLGGEGLKYLLALDLGKLISLFTKNLITLTKFNFTIIALLTILVISVGFYKSLTKLYNTASNKLNKYYYGLIRITVVLTISGYSILLFLHLYRVF